ncbi:Phytanoyl-CoA dioxygenase, peroxisomal [Orchesella cincta]|uniref:phytanoyl-CoA dioxygenase n=1 Tax=Orchesella cincta TaxID=48709 RepID=A0A1D2N3I4_ORCCI|nr:Phytanoyl-CoA dioxygenase, peroxisomal [Orchesella cincta]
MGLTFDQKEFYKKNGYILLDNIFTNGEIDEISDTCDKVFDLKKVQNSNMEATWEGSWRTSESHATNEKSVLSIHNLQCHSSAFTNTLVNKNLVDAVADIIGSPNVLLHHSKAHVKPPEKGTSYPTHQDYHYFPYKNHSPVAAFIHLDDSDQENGGLCVFPGSHLLGPLQDKSDAHSHHYVDQEQFPIEKATPVHAKKGQVLIFSYLLVHASYPNVSTRRRRMLLIQMMAAEDKPTKQVHISPCHGMVLRGQNVDCRADINRSFIGEVELR